MEAGKRRLAGDTARAANTDEVKDLRCEARGLKEVVAEPTLEIRLLCHSCWAQHFQSCNVSQRAKPP
jgi:hypothetical protein